jgi:hypothetical protein
LPQSDTQDSTSSTPSLFEFSPPQPPLLKRWAAALVQPKSDDSEEGIRGGLGLHLLHLSPEPLVNLIFVHGLRGGSVKTWRKGKNPGLFWPQCWLPLEKGFEHANIYSFGYDSDWLTTSRRDLNLHNFGMELFEVMRSSQHLRAHAEVRIQVVAALGEVTDGV